MPYEHFHLCKLDMPICHLVYSICILSLLTNLSVLVSCNSILNGLVYFINVLYILQDKLSARSTFMSWSLKSFIAKKQILYRYVIFDHFPVLR